MKKTLLIGLLISLSIQSQALVSDRFECSISVKDFETNTMVSQVQDFFVGRLPSPSESGEDFKKTAGQTRIHLKLVTEKAWLTGNLNFYYKHAIREEHGRPFQARQMTCINLTGGYCKKGDGPDMQICSSMEMACLETGDSPFDSNSGWSPSAIVDGLPVFDDRAIAPLLYQIKDDQGVHKGLVKAECRFIGSYQ